MVSGMISLVNAARIKNGRSSLGWINPIVYRNYSVFARDVVAGKNFLLLILLGNSTNFGI